MKVFSSIVFFVFLHATLTAQQVSPGTWSYRTDNEVPVGTTLRVSSYYDMNNWNTSPYEEFYYKNNSAFINFRLLKPKGYNPDNTAKKYPLIVLLHGVGEAGRRGLESDNFSTYANDNPRLWNNDHHLIHGGRQHLDAVNRDPNNSRAFPGFVFVPQNIDFWGDGDRNRAIAALEWVIKNNNVDPNRIYMHGLSNGGNGVWRIAQQRPDLFAAILPMSNAEPLKNPGSLVHIPIWHFQGRQDKNPEYLDAIKLQDGLKALGATPRYTEYFYGGHGIWNKAYAEPDFFSWMLGKHKTDIHAFFGNTEVCPGEAVNIKLGITAGFKAYQWKTIINGTETANAGSTNEIQATDYGQYFVRFSRVDNPAEGDWTPWSKPLTIKIKALTPTPEITVRNSATLPSSDNEPTRLEAPPDYSSYKWFRNGAIIPTATTASLAANEGGSYTVKVTEANGGCESLLSNAVRITKDQPTDAVGTPQELKAVAVSATSINLFWKDMAANETGYEVYRSTKSGSDYKFVALTSADQISFTDYNLQSNTTYYYVVRGVNEAGSSAKSNEASASTGEDTEAPGAPGNLKVTGANDNTIKLIWNSATDNIAVTAYEIYRDGSLIGTTADTVFDVTGLTKQTMYAFTVKAKDQAGNKSSPSNQVTAVTQFEGLIYYYRDGQPWSNVADYKDYPIEKQGFIDNFSIAYIKNGGARPDIAENYFAFDFEGYLYIRQAGTYLFQVVASAGSNLYISGNIVVDNDGNHGKLTRTGAVELAAGAHPIVIKYLDRSENEFLEVSYKGIDTNDNMILIPDQALKSGDFQYPSPPAAPTEFVATTAGMDKIKLIWTDNSSGNKKYEIYRAGKVSGEYKLVLTTSTNATTIDDNGLSGGTTYFYKIKTVSSKGASDFASQIASAATAVDNIDPTTPEDLAVMSYGLNSMSLSWSPAQDNVGIAGYELYLFTSNPDNSGARIGEYNELVKTTATSYTFYNLDPETTYFFKVAAKDPSGNFSARSTTVNGTTLNSRALPIRLVHFSGSIADGQVTLAWTTAGEQNNDFFTLERSSDAKTFKPIGQVDGAGNSTQNITYAFEDQNPLKGLNYYRLKQTDFNGEFTYSPTIMVHNRAENETLSVVLFPVPVENGILYSNFTLPNLNNPVNIQLRDSYGRLIMQRSVDPNTLSETYNLLQNTVIGKGIYILQVEQAGYTVNKKFAAY